MLAKNIFYSLSVGLFLTTANFAMAQTTEGKKNTNLLADKIAGKLTLTGNVGYIYNFGGTGLILSTKGSSNVGYGASLGWTHKSGFGLNMDYLRFGHSWQGAGPNGVGSYNYESSQNILNLVPSYRFALDKNEHWGLRLGLGLGLNIANLSYTKLVATNQAIGTGGAVYTVMAYRLTNDPNPLDSIYTSLYLYNKKTNFYTKNFPDIKEISQPSLIKGKETQCGLFSDSYGLSPNSNSQTISNGDTYSFYQVAADKTLSPDISKNNCYAYSDGIPSPPQIFLNEATNGFSDKEIINWITNITDTELENIMVIIYGTMAPDIAAAYEERLSRYNGNQKAGEGVSWGLVANGATAAANTAERALGFVLLPQLAVEYDNGLLHTDISLKYMHAVTALNHKGTTSLGAPTTYTIPSGPMALFIGAGLGLNF